jgi:hypothetical protein
VTAAEGASPDRNPRGVYSTERAGVLDRCLPVAELTADIQQLARVPVTVAEVAVIEDEGREPGLSEALGVRVEALVADRREAVRQDNTRGCWPALAFRSI